MSGDGVTRVPNLADAIRADAKRASDAIRAEDFDLTARIVLMDLRDHQQANRSHWLSMFTGAMRAEHRLTMSSTEIVRLWRKYMSEYGPTHDIDTGQRIER